MIRYLGIDWGKKKSGLASADSELKIASVLQVVPTDQLPKAIRQFQAENPGDLVIVWGETKFKNNFGNQGLEQEKKKIVDRLRKEGYRIELAEEMFSTKTAQHNLYKKKTQPRQRRQDDAESARIILQNWLDCKY